MSTASEVLAGTARWGADCADALAWLRALPDDSVDLLFTSPPYELARTYGIGERMVGGEEWVAWMVEVFRAAAPKVKGLIAVNCEGQTRDYSYSGVPFLLFADLKRAGFNVRKPPVFHRVGIPGSGGPDWLRNDYEPVVCVTRPGKLPWSDNTACGNVPKYAPGGAMSNREADGRRVNSELFDAGARSVMAPIKNALGVDRAGVRVGARRGKNDHKATAERPAHAQRKVITRDRPGQRKPGPNGNAYDPPSLANPGNVLYIPVGGGLMGSPHAHDNEAPFPLELAAFFVLSFCPPAGVVADPFLGSGTTIDAAVQHGRRGIGCDVRESQVELTRRRMRNVTPSIFEEE